MVLEENHSLGSSVTCRNVKLFVLVEDERASMKTRGGAG